MALADYMAIPWASGGRDASGCDCWGWVRLVAQGEFGAALPAYADGYLDAMDREEVGRLANGERGCWQEVAAGGERPGDLVLLRICGQPCHVGIVVDRLRMAHNMKSTGPVIERYDRPKWARRVDGFFRPAR